MVDSPRILKICDARLEPTWTGAASLCSGRACPAIEHLACAQEGGEGLSQRAARAAARLTAMLAVVEGREAAAGQTQHEAQSLLRQAEELRTTAEQQGCEGLRGRRERARSSKEGR